MNPPLGERQGCRPDTRLRDFIPQTPFFASRRLQAGYISANFVCQREMKRDVNFRAQSRDPRVSTLGHLGRGMGGPGGSGEGIETLPDPSGPSGARTPPEAISQFPISLLSHDSPTPANSTQTDRCTVPPSPGPAGTCPTKARAAAPQQSSSICPDTAL